MERLLADVCVEWECFHQMDRLTPDEACLPSGWCYEECGGALVKSFRFADFAAAFAFLAKVAEHAETVGHHPEFTSVWNRVDFRLTSHDAGGVTERDLTLAEAIDALAARAAGVTRRGNGANL